MSDFLSKYTGQEIESILGSVDGKIAKADIVTVFLNDSQSPAAASLTYKLNTDLKNLSDDLVNNYMRIDSGSQTVNGTKTFAALITANGGVAVPTGKTITIVDEPTSSSQVVNLSFLRKHGVSEDTTPIGSGLAIRILDTGYNALKMDVSKLKGYSGSTPPLSIPALADTGETVSISFQSIINYFLASESVTTKLVLKADYDEAMEDVSTEIGNRVTTETYNAKIVEINNALDGKQGFGKTNTLAIAQNGTGTIDVAKANCTVMLLTAAWGSVVDIMRLTVHSDNSILLEPVIKKSAANAGVTAVVTSISGNRQRITFTNANTTTQVAIDYKLTASF